MIDNISESKYVVGTRQTLKAIKTGSARHVYIAKDSDREIKDTVKKNCKKYSVGYEMVTSMKEIGRACNISLPAAVACNIK